MEETKDLVIKAIRINADSGSSQSFISSIAFSFISSSPFPLFWLRLKFQLRESAHGIVRGGSAHLAGGREAPAEFGPQGALMDRAQVFRGEVRAPDARGFAARHSRQRRRYRRRDAAGGAPGAAQCHRFRVGTDFAHVFILKHRQLGPLFLTLPTIELCLKGLDYQAELLPMNAPGNRWTA